MVLAALKWFLIVVSAVIVVAICVLAVGSTFSMDRSFTYTQQADLLPVLDTESSGIDGVELVRIPIGEFEFRARVAGNPQSDQLVVLLHGFPVTSAMWLPIMAPFF